MEVDTLVKEQLAVVELFVEVDPSLTEGLRHRRVHLLVGLVLYGQIVGSRQQLCYVSLLHLRR